MDIWRRLASFPACSPLAITRAGRRPIGPIRVHPLHPSSASSSTPLTPRKAQPSTEQLDAACPWEDTGPPLARKVSLGAPQDRERAATSAISRPLSLSYLPAGSADAPHAKSPLPQPQVRKKSSSAVSADDEIIIRKTSKSSPSVSGPPPAASPQHRGANGEEPGAGSPPCLHQAGEDLPWLPTVPDVCPWEDE